MTETIWFLKRCSLFEGLAPDECRRLEARAKARSFSRRSMIYFPDEAGETLLLLTAGRVKILSLALTGRETILAFVEPGEVFGELAILDSGPRAEHAEAVLDSRVLAIPREEVLWLMDRRPEVALSITKLLGFRLRRIRHRLQNVLFRSNRERVVGILLELMESHGRVVDGGWEIGMRLSHQELASLIGSTRETVTLTLGQLQSEGLIDVKRRRITIPNRERLTAGATGPSNPKPDLQRVKR